MPLVAGDRVAAAISGLGQTPEHRPINDFAFGTVSANAQDAIDVIWDNGNFSEGVPAAALDRIQQFASTHVGRVVLPLADNLDVYSQEYRGIVIGAYTRDPAGAGTPPLLGPYCMVRALQAGGCVYEVLDTLVQNLAGQ